MKNSPYSITHYKGKSVTCKGFYCSLGVDLFKMLVIKWNKVYKNTKSFRNLGKVKVMNDGQSTRQQIVDKIKEAENILITVSTSPSVDELSAALGLTLFLDKIEKRATAVVSGKIPPAIQFLKPDQTFEPTVDSLRDFIVALDKEKVDHLRYKLVDDKKVTIFITPYKTKIDEKDFEFSQGDYNVDLVIAIGVNDEEHLDTALAAHGRILHDATVVTVMAGGKVSTLGSIDWNNPRASSLSEMAVSLAEGVDNNKKIFDAQISTAFLTGIVAATDRFSNKQTSSKAMTIAAKLMAAGANQQLIARSLNKPEKDQSKDNKKSNSGNKNEKPKTLNENSVASIKHDKNQSKKSEKKPTEEVKEAPKPKPDDNTLVIQHPRKASLDEVREEVEEKNRREAAIKAEDSLSKHLMAAGAVAGGTVAASEILKEAAKGKGVENSIDTTLSENRRVEPKREIKEEVKPELVDPFAAHLNIAPQATPEVADANQESPEVFLPTEPSAIQPTVQSPDFGVNEEVQQNLGQAFENASLQVAPDYGQFNDNIVPTLPQIQPTENTSPIGPAKGIGITEISENKPLIGGTLNATSSQAEQDSRAQLQDDRNKITLNHGGYIGNQTPTFNAPINSVNDQDSYSEPNVDPFAGSANQGYESKSDLNIQPTSNDMHEDAMAAVNAAFEQDPVADTGLTYDETPLNSQPTMQEVQQVPQSQDSFVNPVDNNFAQAPSQDFNQQPAYAPDNQFQPQPLPETPGLPPLPPMPDFSNLPPMPPTMPQQPDFMNQAPAQAPVDSSFAPVDIPDFNAGMQPSLPPVDNSFVAPVSMPQQPVADQPSQDPSQYRIPGQY